MMVPLMAVPFACLVSVSAMEVQPRASEAVTVPITIDADHLQVDVTINGEGPFHFLLDSGAVNVLTPALAKRLALPEGKRISATGTGGTQQATRTKVASVAIGGVTLTDQDFYVVELPSAAVTGRQVDGLIGHGWLGKIPTRIDYEASTLTFYPPGWRYAGAARPVPLTFKGTKPQIDAEVDGVAGRFTIDTGSAGSLTLYPAFAEQHGLAARYGARTRIMSGVGIGGPVFSLLARANLLELAGSRIERPVTYLSQARAGAATDKTTAGSLGQGVLRRFNLVFDYPHDVAYFEPNNTLGDPDLADRSGLRLEGAAEGFRIVYVAEGSPAAVAGLRADEIITEVDGVAASRIAMKDLRARLKGSIGSGVTLEIVGRPTPVVIVLKEL